jgi:hypothetical protein
MNEIAFTFIKKLNKFEYRISFKDRIWNVIFPDKKGKYHYLIVTKYREDFYIGDMDGNLPTIEITPKKNTLTIAQDSHSHWRYTPNPEVAWKDLLTEASRWLEVVKKDWVKANKKIMEFYPLNRRYGIVPHSIVRASVPEIYQIDKDLGKKKVQSFINLVESGYFLDDKNTSRESMTANDFFEYCKIAYLAGQRKEDKVDANLSGKELYQHYADGRHEGLTEIDGNSLEEFSDWLDGKHPKKSSGGHPWEIKRGGNTTHIDLVVSRSRYREDGPFTVSLHGPASTRLKETICMFLGIHDAGLPITIVNPEGIRKRLLAQDNIGIIPGFDSLHRANQRYHEHEDVYDVLHYDDFGRQKRRIQPFITWESLPILKPVKDSFER